MEKKLVIFDIDQTLLDCNLETNVTVVRKHAIKLLAWCVEKGYHISLWSLGSPAYVDSVVNTTLKDFKEDFKFVWSRDRATPSFPMYGTPVMVKRLASVWDKFPAYKSHNTLLIDDSHIHKERNYYNVIKVPEFFADKKIKYEDDYLVHVQSILDSAYKLVDVRDIIYNSRG